MDDDMQVCSSVFVMGYPICMLETAMLLLSQLGMYEEDADHLLNIL